MTAAVTAALYLSIAALAISTITLVIAAKAPTKPGRRRQVHLRSISAAEIEAVEVMIKTAKANGWNEGYAAGMALQVPEPGA